MHRWLTSLAVVVFVALGLRPSTVATQGPPQTGIVTTQFTMIQEGNWERKIFAAQDSIKVTTTETCRFEIVNWSEDGVTLQRQYCDAVVTADGNGATAYPAPATNTSWTYFAPKPTSPLTDVNLDPATGEGQITLGGSQVLARTADGAESQGGGMGPLMISTLMTVAALGKVPEGTGVQFSGGRDLYEVQRFKFPPKAAKFSGGNQGAWTMSWTESDGATGRATANLSYTVSWGQDDKPGEMVFKPEAGYATWLPAPALTQAAGARFEPEGRPLRVTVTIKPATPGQSPKKARIDFSLADVSRHGGICGNFPPMGKEKDDLRFAAEQPDGIVVDGPKAAHTSEEVSEATIVVEALDTAAWGKLVARASSLGLVAKYEPWGTYSLTIPADRNENRIADSWEGRNQDLDPDADDEQVAGQDMNGDGITIGEEYRGVVVAEGGLVHRRLSLREKEMFIIDPGQAFPVDVWKRVAHVQAYRVTDNLVVPAANSARTSPLVNSNAENDAHPFYALRVRRMDGDVDPDPGSYRGDVQPTTTAPGAFPLMAYAFPPADFINGEDHVRPGIKGADYVKIFPDRVRIFVDLETKWLETALRDPTSDAGILLRDPLMKFSLAEAAQALSVLRTPTGRAMVEKKITTLLFLHEVGHVCGGLEDHELDTAPNDEVRECLMFYPAKYSVHRMVAVTALGRGDPDLSYPARTFCTTLGCAARISVKDW